MLQYNGLYISSVEDVFGGSISYSHLRFYEDGLVMQVTTSGNPHEVSKWFHRDSPNQLKGFFEISGPRRDTIFCRFEHVHYLGVIKDDRLILHTSNSNEWQIDEDEIEEFKFVAI